MWRHDICNRVVHSVCMYVSVLLGCICLCVRVCACIGLIFSLALFYVLSDRGAMSVSSIRMV